MEEAELTETPDADVTEERDEWTIERAWSGKPEEIRRSREALSSSDQLDTNAGQASRDNTLMSLKRWDDVLRQQFAV